MHRIEKEGDRLRYYTHAHDDDYLSIYYHYPVVLEGVILRYNVYTKYRKLNKRRNNSQRKLFEDSHNLTKENSLYRNDRLPRMLDLAFLNFVKFNRFKMSYKI